MSDPVCLNCGVPLTRNRHPLAGKMSHLNIVGAEWGCLPCAEMRANGRHRVLSALREELHKRIESGVPMNCAAMLGMIESLDEDRKMESFRETTNCLELLASEYHPEFDDDDDDFGDEDSEWESWCQSCNGTGEHEFSGVPCIYCDGTGWI